MFHNGIRFLLLKRNGSALKCTETQVRVAFENVYHKNFNIENFHYVPWVKQRKAPKTVCG